MENKKTVRLPNNCVLTLKHRCRIFNLFFPKNFLFSWNEIVWIPKNIPLNEVKLNELFRENIYLYWQTRLGKWVWLYRFIFNKKFRLRQFIPAYVIQLKYTISSSERYEIISLAAKQLSSHYFIRCGTYNNIYNDILDKYVYANLISDFTPKKTLDGIEN